MWCFQFAGPPTTCKSCNDNVFSIMKSTAKCQKCKYDFCLEKHTAKLCFVDNKKFYILCETDKIHLDNTKNSLVLFILHCKIIHFPRDVQNIITQKVFDDFILN